MSKMAREMLEGAAITLAAILGFSALGYLLGKIL